MIAVALSIDRNWYWPDTMLALIMHTLITYFVCKVLKKPWLIAFFKWRTIANNRMYKNIWTHLLLSNNFLKQEQNVFVSMPICEILGAAWYYFFFFLCNFNVGFGHPCKEQLIFWCHGLVNCTFIDFYKIFFERESCFFWTPNITVILALANFP